MKRPGDGWKHARPARRAALIVSALAMTGMAALQAPNLPFQYGARVDVDAFVYHRPIGTGPAGLSELELDPAALAHCRRDFADLRIVDPHGRQVPYLLVRPSEPLTVRLPALEKDTTPEARMERPTAPGLVSRYLIRLPYTNLPPSTLVLTTTARVFQRELRLRGADRRPGDEHGPTSLELLDTPAWTHADPASDAPPLRIEIRSLPTNVLHLVVEEGDNAPLPLGAPTLLLPNVRVRFIRPDDVPLQVVYGNRDAEPPRYDLSLVAGSILDAPAQQVKAGPEPVRKTPLPAGFLFWWALAAAVVVLVVVIARLVRPVT